MVKTKSGRSMNPTDAYRKEERRKQVNRNKLERKFQREAHRKINNASSLRDELTSIIASGDDGALNKTMRLKKKVLKDAYDQALRKQKAFPPKKLKTMLCRKQKFDLNSKRKKKKLYPSSDILQPWPLYNKRYPYLHHRHCRLDQDPSKPIV